MNSASLPYTVAAFYGFEIGAAQVAEWYETVLQWFDKNGCPPERIGVHGEGFSGKLVSFVGPNARLRKSGFERIDSIEIQSKPPDDAPKAVDGRMSADLSMRSNYAVVCADSSIVSFETIFDVVHPIVKYLKPCYGICYQRERRLGPSFYALGINYGTHHIFSGPIYEEGVRISSWINGMSQQVYRQGLLRDVYLYNFLTHAQLSRSVEGSSLQKWIQSNPGHGTLTRFEGEVWLWCVEEDQISELRDVLRTQGAIFNLK